MNPLNVSADISDADMAEILHLIEQIDAKLPFLISMTPDQRKACLKLGDKSIGFVEKAIDYSNTNMSLRPAWLDMDEFTKDFKLTKNLLEILRHMKPLAQNIEDTATEAGVETFGAAIVFYNSVKNATKTNVPGAKSIYEDLQKRFPGGSSRKPADQHPEGPPAPGQE